MDSQMNMDDKLYLVNMMKTALQSAKIARLQSFTEWYINLILPIYDPTQSSMLIPLHEELKESVVQSLKYLFLKTSTDVIKSIYTREHAAKLSQGIYICLSIARTERSSSLRIAAIEALITVAYVYDEADHNDVALRSQIAEIMMLFLPGIVKGLQDIYRGSDVQNHKVTMMAVRALGRIVALIMEDLPQNSTISTSMCLPNVEKTLSDPLRKLLRKGGHNGMNEIIETVVRSQEWLDAAAEKLQATLEDLMSITKHPHFKVRRELVQTVMLLLSKCPHNMRKSFAELVEILICLSEDDMDEIRNSASEALININHIVTTYQMRPIIARLEERFYQLLTKLPRLIRRSDDATQLSHLNQLAGYLKLLGKERLPQIMTSMAHLRRLLLALVYVAELDYKSITILEKNEVRSLEVSTYKTMPSWRTFQFIHDSAAEDKLILICKLLGSFGDLAILVDSIFELIRDMRQHRRELLLLLNWILSTNATQQCTLYQQVIDYYTDPEFWYLPIQVQDSVSLRDVQGNVIQICLLTEGLGLFSTALQNDYQRFLLKTLYLIIERAGSGHELISLAGLNSLEKIAKSQGHVNITELIRSNLDYFSYHVTMKLRRVEKNPGVLNVLSVVMEYSTLDVMPCLKEIVEDALTQLGTNFRKGDSYALLKVLYTFTLCIRQLSCQKNTNQQQSEAKISNCTAERVIQSVLDHYEAKKASEQTDNDDISGTPEDILKEFEKKDIDELNEAIEEEKKEIPSHINMIENVMKQCLHFLPSKDISICILAMQILQEGLHILVPWTEQLLPIIHELWHPLVDRFQDPNVLIINYSWQLLYTLSHVSDDFIRLRTLTQVSPALAKFLNKAAQESYKKNRKDAYKFTQMFKLQKLLLKELGSVTKCLKLREEELWKLLSITEVYLNCYQQPELQDCCLELYKHISSYNADVVWVKCLSLWNTHVTPIPKDGTFTMGDLKMDQPIKSPYKKNVMDVLVYIDEMTQAMDRENCISEK